MILALGDTFRPKSDCTAAGFFTSSVMALPACSARTSIASASALSAACFSTSIRTSGLSHDRTSTDPSKVMTVRSGVPETLKVFSSLVE